MENRISTAREIKVEPEITICNGIKEDAGIEK